MVYFNDEMCNFKSEPDFYDLEHYGAKSCTVRILSSDEVATLQDCTIIRIHIKAHPRRYFERKITNVSQVGTLAGKALVVISWVHPWGRPDEV